MRKMKEGKLMEAPDDIWIQILEFGIQKSILYSSDLCSLSISCKRFDKLSNDNTLWSSLLTLKFPKKCDDVTSSSSSSKKTVFKYRLKKYLQRELASVNIDIFKDRYRLGRLTKRIKRLRREVVVMTEQKKELCGEILDIIKESPIKHRQNIEWLNAGMITMDEEIKRFSGDSTGIIKESGQAPPPDIAAPSTDPLDSAPTVSALASFCTFFELPVRLKTKIDHIASLQQGIFSTLEQHELDMHALDHRQKEYDELLAVLTYRLALLDASFQPTEVDEDGDTEDLDSVESTEDDDDDDTDVTEDDDNDDSAYDYDTATTEDDDCAEDFQ